MLCKKCGADISDSSKFCGYCGNAVELESEIVNAKTSGSDSISEFDLGKTIKIEPTEENINNNITETVNEDGSSVVPQLQSTAEPNIEVCKPNKKDPKKNKLLIIILGVVLGVIAIAGVLFAFMNSSNNSISVLKQTVANFKEIGKNNATVDVKLSYATTSEDSFTFSATSKIEKKNDDKTDIELTIHKSLLFDEMNIYGTLTKEEFNVYLESSLIDLLGFTSSEKPSWLYYTLKLDEIITDEAKEDLQNVALEDVIDEKHFIFMDKTNTIKHYQLIIDQELIDKLELLDTEEVISATEPLEKPVKIDFYINNSNELEKIVLDMTDSLSDNEDVLSLIVEIEFKDLGSTKVEVPESAKNSVMDIETYMATNINTTPETEIEYNGFETVDSNNYGYEF